MKRSNVCLIFSPDSTHRFVHLALVSKVQTGGIWSPNLCHLTAKLYYFIFIQTGRMGAGPTDIRKYGGIRSSVARATRGLKGGKLHCQLLTILGLCRCWFISDLNCQTNMTEVWLLSYCSSTSILLEKHWFK